MDKDRLLEALRAHFDSSAAHVTAAYLFGSVARGEDRPDSDVDLAVLLAADPPHTLAALELELEGDLEHLLGRPVQLVVLNRAPADLVHRVLRDGQLVCDRDRAARIRFEVARRAEYLDLLPVLERYRRPLLGASRLGST